MINRRNLFLEGLGGMLLAQAAASAASTSKPVFTHDLPHVDLKNWAATALEVTWAPGQSSDAHRHPGITIVYVLEGSVRSKVGGGPEKIYQKGEMFLETPDELHAASGNASKTQPAKILAILLAEKGKPLTKPV